MSDDHHIKRGELGTVRDVKILLSNRPEMCACLARRSKSGPKVTLE